MWICLSIFLSTDEYLSISKPTKLLIGTESGQIVISNRKGKNKSEKLGSILKAFDGHTHAVARNPFYPKFFLAASDAQIDLWCEDVKESPMVTLNYTDCSISSICWSVSRPAVFFLSTKNGFIEVFDLLERLDRSVHKLKVISIKITGIF